MNQNKINGLIGFAIRSRSISFKQTLVKDVNHKKVNLIIYASDVSENTLNEYKNEINSVKSIKYLTKNELGYLFNKENVGIFGIKNPNIAKEIIRIYNEEEVQDEEK